VLGQANGAFVFAVVISADMREIGPFDGTKATPIAETTAAQRRASVALLGLRARQERAQFAHGRLPPGDRAELLGSSETPQWGWRTAFLRFAWRRAARTRRSSS
jgi:hypothetical protein